jgi:hypothetical protein
VVDSPTVAAWVAHLTFWILLAYGWTTGDLGIRGTIVALSLWVTAYLGQSFVPLGGVLFPSFVAVIDIALVLVIFESDVRLR